MFEGDVKYLQDIFGEESLSYEKFLQNIADLKKEKKIIIYGAGIWGKWIFQILNRYSVDVVAFLDEKADEIMEINGIPVFKPKCDDFTQAEKEEWNIIIATNYMHHKSVRQRLYELGYKNVNILKFVWYAGIFSFDLNLNFINNEKNDFLNCANIFEDEKSYKIYEDAIRSYVSGQCIMSAKADSNNQYFPEDIPFTKGYSRVVDCGAYTGDTIEKLSENKGKVDAIIAFEPDVENFYKLTKTVEMNKDSIADNIILYPCGVWNELEQFNFSNGQGSRSIIDKEGNSIIQCVALDDVLLNFNPTFIKMDIEGSEYKALLGAKRIIHQYKPDLAICVYHSIADFCRIPLLINSWNLGYKFYLRCHENFNQEVVMYATCE